jgi:hypothetical protein
MLLILFEAATGAEMLSGAEATANKTNMLEADANLIAGEADRDAFFVNAPTPTIAVTVLLSETQSPTSLKKSALAFNRNLK